MSTDDDSQITLFGAAPAAKPKPVKITLSKTVNASVQATFDQWLIPVFLGNWMFGKALGDEEVIHLENQVRAKGSINYQIRRGGVALTFLGCFSRLRIPSELEITWVCNDAENEADVIAVQFEDLGEKTRLKLTHLVSADSAESPDQAKELWAKRLNLLAAVLNK